VKPIAGLLLYSGALICESLWRKSAQESSLSLPFVQSHGRIDPILPIATGRWLHQLLIELGCTGDLLEFNGPHTIPGEAIEQTAKLLSN